LMMSSSLGLRSLSRGASCLEGRSITSYFTPNLAAIF
jgi:hypothetical protein